MPDREADAEMYVLALCEDRIAKYDECEEFVPAGWEQTLEECIEAQTEDFDDPCFPEEDEFARCLQERETCEDFFDVYVGTTPDSACFELWVLLGQCLVSHPER